MESRKISPGAVVRPYLVSAPHQVWRATAWAARRTLTKRGQRLLATTTSTCWTNSRRRNSTAKANWATDRTTSPLVRPQTTSATPPLLLLANRVLSSQPFNSFRFLFVTATFLIFELTVKSILLTAYAWRTPFLSNRIACTEAAGKLTTQVHASYFICVFIFFLWFFFLHPHCTHLHLHMPHLASALFDVLSRNM